MTNVRIGVIGVGLIGKIHLDLYAKIPDAEIVAVCDVNEKEAKKVAEQFGIPHVYTDYREMLDRDDIVAVDVCLHNNMHASMTIEAMKAGKHVYCEKPIAGTYYDGKRMVEAAEAYGKMLHVQLNSLFKTETKAAKQLIDAGELGRLYHARANSYRRRNRPFVDGYGTKFFTRKASATGGALIDNGVYDIGQMIYLLGLPDPVRISGQTYQEMDMDEQRRNESDFDVEELALGFVKFKDNISLDIRSAWSIHLNEFEGSSIVGSQGGVRFSAQHEGVEKAPFSFHTTIADMDFNSTVNLDLTDLRWHSLHANEDAYDSSQHHWIAALQGRVDLIPSAEVTLKTMLISEGIYISSERGEEVTAEELEARSISTDIKV